MPKQKIKSRRSATKRFKIKGSGKIRRSQANKNHILTKKSRKRKNRLKKPAYISKPDEQRILKCMPNG